jgi:hypothetical protein
LTVLPIHRKKKLKYDYNKDTTNTLAGCWWLMPVILPTWEAKIERIMVQGHPRQKIS